MRSSQHLLTIVVGLVTIGLAAPHPAQGSIIDTADAQKPYKSEVDAQAATIKRDDQIIDTADAQKPYKSEVDAQAASKRDDQITDAADAQKPYKSEVDTQAASGRI